MMTFEYIVSLGQKNLKKKLRNELKKYYPPTDVVSGDGYLLAKGSQIMLTAHMDTVHEKPACTIVREKVGDLTKLSSPQGLGGDDRSGLWIILQILYRTDFRPTILFCEDEEIGSIGAGKFAETKEAVVLQNMKYLVELDRRNADDAVFYYCGNKEFQKYITDKTGNKKAEGSWSDICELSPIGDVASVNLSCGYYKEHKPETYVIEEEMEAVVGKVTALLEDETNVEKFEFCEEKFSTFWDGYGKGDYSYYRSYYDTISDYDDFSYVVTAFHNGKEIYCDYVGDEFRCLAQFMMDNPDVPYSEVVSVVPYDEYVDYYDGGQFGAYSQK